MRAKAGSRTYALAPSGVAGSIAIREPNRYAPKVAIPRKRPTMAMLRTSLISRKKRTCGDMPGVARELPPHPERGLAQVRQPATKGPCGCHTGDPCRVTGDDESPSFHPEA